MKLDQRRRRRQDTQMKQSSPRPLSVTVLRDESETADGIQSSFLSKVVTGKDQLIVTMAMAYNQRTY